MRYTISFPRFQCGQGACADVAAPVQFVKMDAVGGRVGFFQRGGQVGGGGGHAQHAAAGGDQPAVLDGGTGMVDDGVAAGQLAVYKAGDLLALLVGEG